MKPTGLYYEHLNYPYEFRCFRLGRSTWRFNAQNLDTGMFANYLFSVFHELGHMRGRGAVTRLKCRFAEEYEAWNWAIENYMMTFGENITDRQAKYMLGCLSSYTNNKDNFWCPMKGETK